MRVRLKPADPYGHERALLSTLSKAEQEAANRLPTMLVEGLRAG